jgi:hypothetical protein
VVETRGDREPVEVSLPTAGADEFRRFRVVGE